MTKNTKEITKHDLRIMTIVAGPEPMSVRNVKAMTDRLLSLRQEIIEIADPEMCRTLLPAVERCLDDLVDSINLQAQVRHRFEAAQALFARKKMAIGR